jgi:eukaryotic-like serine/threonine-protein kinase
MSCPLALQVRTFVIGALDEERARAMRAHIEECETCFLEVAAAAAGTSQEIALGSDFAAGSSLSPASGVSFALRHTPSTGELPVANLPAEIGPYAIDAIVGEGGMGTIYRGFDRSTGEPVAIKTVRVPTRSLFESLRQEIELLSQVRHPDIVRVIGYDLTGGDPWYAMELVPGETLAARLRSLWQNRGNGMPAAANGHLQEITNLFKKLCEPIGFLHRSGIVHCDLKPSNILLRRNGNPVLMDFGLVTNARGAVDREALAVVAGPRGTLSYAAPEVLRGDVPDPRADLYALGCILYEAVTGQNPFSGSRDEIVQGHLHRMPVAASELVSGVSPALDALLTSLLAKDVRNRLGNASEMERELAALSGEPQVGGPRDSVFFRPRLVGRSEDLAQVDECLNRLFRGQGTLLLVGGESGIGKTFFASEAARRAAGRRVKVVIGECDPPAPHAAGSLEMATSALGPLRRYFEFVRDGCREGGPDALKRLLGDALPALAPYSPALASLRDQTPIPELSKLPQDAGRERLLTALTQTLAASVNEAPLMLVLDDLQWADELTLALFETLRARTLANLPLFILATYRLEDQTRAIGDLSRQPDVVTLTLGRLPRTAVASMVSDMVGRGEAAHGLVDFVYSHAEGVPFFTAEYLRSIVSEGLLAGAEEGWRLPASGSGDLLSNLPFPIRLAELILRRTSGLSARTTEALQAGAALGREFDLDVLARVLGVSQDDARDSIHEALARHIVLDAEGSIRFAHDKFRESIYARLPETRRRAFHAGAARAIEHRYRDRSDFEYVYGDIARHFRLAGETGAAIDYLEKAAERSLRISADAEALQFLNEAVELERALPTRIPSHRRAIWERGVAEALHGLGRLSESAPPLTRAAELLGHGIPKTPAALGLAIASHLGRRLLPGSLRKQPADPDERATSAEMGRVLERVLRISYYTGNNLQLLYACVASLTFCERAGPSADLATAYSNAAATAGIVPLHQLARSFFKRASNLLANTPSPVEESQLRMLESSYYMGLGDQTKAIPLAEAGIEVAGRIGFHRRVDECAAIRCGIEIHAGRHQEIEWYTAQTESSARLRGDAQMLSWALLQQVEGLVMRGEFREACAQLDSVWPLFPTAERAEKIWILGFAAYAHYRCGHRLRAVEHADQAAELARKGALVQLYCMNALDRLAELRLLRSHEEPRVHRGNQLDKDAVLACRQLCGLARIFPFGGPAARLHTGILSWRKGKLEAARTLWREGRAEAGRMGLSYHEARLLLVLGKGAETKSERDQSRQRCLELLDRLQISKESLILDRLLAQTRF